MPIASEPGGAAQACLAEVQVWAGIAASWAEVPPPLVDDVAPMESAVMRTADHVEDLNRRAATWGFEITTGDLAEVSRFGAGLAAAEARAWDADEPHVATRAYADRRFLLGDRLVHWAVPWLSSVTDAYPELADKAVATSRGLLLMGDSMRPAPALTASEGLVIPGHDSYGLLAPEPPGGGLLSGMVVLAPHRANLEEAYGEAEQRWVRLAGGHPGTARLWTDLAARTSTTLHGFRGFEP